MDSNVWTILLVALFAINVHGIRFTLMPKAQKCVTDEIQANQLVVIEFEISDAPEQQIDFIARDSKGGILSQKESLSKKAQASFTSEIMDTYELCVFSRATHGVKQEISIVTKKGVEARNYDGIGEGGKLKPLEVDLKRLEDMAVGIVQVFAVTRNRQEEMRSTNESTNNRLLFFSMFSMCCLLGLATWQVLYLRRYFKSKKLIE